MDFAQGFNLLESVLAKSQVSQILKCTSTTGKTQLLIPPQINQVPDSYPSFFDGKKPKQRNFQAEITRFVLNEFALQASIKSEENVYVDPSIE